MVDAPDPDRVSTPPSDPPSSEDTKKAKTKQRLETAKSFAIPSSVIGALITAVTAYVNANDTSLEKKTYETVVTMVEADRKDISAQNARLSAIEQALIQSAIQNRNPVQPAPAPAAEPKDDSEQEAAPAGRGRAAGNHRVDNWDWTLVVPKHRSADPISQESANTDFANATAIANTLGRKVSRKDADGDGIQEAIVIEEAPQAAQEPEPAPDWNEIKE